MAAAPDDTSGIARNRTKARLREGGHAFGTWVIASRNPATIRMIQAAGFDFAFIDMEHSDLSWESMGDLCLMARACGVTPIVRPYSPDPHLVQRVLDLGAMGVMLADIDDPEQVRALRRAALYPPIGERGSTVWAAPQDYQLVRGAAMKQHIDEHMLLAIQIESRRAVEAVDEILDAGEIDLVEVGREDLSTSYGVPLQTRSGVVMEALDRVIEACRRRNVAVGVNSVNMDEVGDLLRRGVRCISYSSDRRILLHAYYDIVQKLHGLAGSKP